jgi:hypothetical protein
MKTCEWAGASLARRSHPWTSAEGDPDSRYYDLTAQPEHIRTSLEDLRGWQQYPAVEAFYTLLERLNHPESALESNDCAFNGPGENEDRSVRKAMQCSGRLMVLFRSLELNTEPERVETLKNELHFDLTATDPSFHFGIIGTTVVPVRYLALPEGRDQQLGSQLMISFWAWGDSEADTMLNLGRLLKNLSGALRQPIHPRHATGPAPEKVRRSRT